MIFGTPTNLKELENHDVWYVDGTFKVQSELYYQLFTINLDINNKSCPLVYACLKNKEQTTYIFFFNQIKSLINKMPKLILSDFEKAIINSIDIVFPDTIIGGCYFHFAKCLWTNMNKKGLSIYYNKETSNKFYKCYNYLKLLVFVPMDMVVEAFEQIKSKLAPRKMLVFIQYMESTFIGKKVRGKADTRTLPLFPINIWNCYNRVLSGEARTNNGIEAWHLAFEVFINYFNFFLN